MEIRDIGPARASRFGRSADGSGLSRNTVRRYLRDEEARRYGPRALRPDKLDPFTRVSSGADRGRRDRTGFRRRCCCARFANAAIDGGISQLKAYLTPFKRSVVEPVVRFETPPGQADAGRTSRGPPRPRPTARVRRDAGLQPRHVRALHGRRGLPDVARVPARKPSRTLAAYPSTCCSTTPRRRARAGRATAPACIAFIPGCWTSPRAVASSRGCADRIGRRTKGKVERFNRYLQGQLLVPLKATLQRRGTDARRRHRQPRGPPLAREVANRRVHGDHRRRAVVTAGRGRGSQLQPLPHGLVNQRAGRPPAPSRARRCPIESLAAPVVRVRGAARGGGMSLQPERIAQLCELLS